MGNLGLPERAQNLRDMVEQGVDVLVIGGGITGCGVALDAAVRGYRVGLVEQNDFASGTSSKSTKLVHGGIRYLPQYDFTLVREALVERGHLTRNAPFLVRPLGFLLPLYKDARRPLGIPIVPPFGIGLGLMLRLGLYLYDFLSGRLGIHPHRRISLHKASTLAPCLKEDGLKDAFIYYDAQTDDTRLTLTVLRTAAAHGAIVANYAEVCGFERIDKAITGARVRDVLTGQEHTIRARYLVNATGVFAERVEAMAGGEPSMRVAPAKGVHLTVPRESLRMMNNTAVVLPETEDGRILFLVPWGPRVTIGTTDTAGGDIERPMASEEDIDYLLRHVNKYMDCTLTRQDIISTWAGYRPLVHAKRSRAKTAQLSRTHAVLLGNGGLITIVGGKLTTYRRMALDTVNEIDKKEGKRGLPDTTTLSLEGAEHWDKVRKTLPAQAAALCLSPDIVRRLENYGDRALVLLDLIREDPALGKRIVSDLPYTMAEVVYACRYEMAATLDDILTRRLHVNFEAWGRGLDVAPAVAERMAAELGWDADEQQRQVAAYRPLES
ncbi:MAG: glycerol-3-phosphate dehydrogenase/oxidase [Chloroflexota bacterium]